jgi:hypothetical protein
MTKDQGSGNPDEELPAKPVLNNDSSGDGGDAESRAEAVRQDTGAIDADAAHERSS